MEQRKYTRVALSTEASIKYNNETFMGVMGNLSITGMYVKTDRSIPLGNKVEITFNDPSTHKNTAVKVNGIAVRKDAYGVGFKLKKSDLDSFIHLRNLVNQSPHL